MRYKEGRRQEAPEEVKKQPRSLTVRQLGRKFRFCYKSRLNGTMGRLDVGSNPTEALHTMRNGGTIH